MKGGTSTAKHMNSNKKRLILLVAVGQLLLAAGFVALPRVVRALPGAYYVRLQNHPATSGVMELLTTPIPTALPAVDIAASNDAVDETDLLAIPGLEDGLATEEPPTATPTVEPTHTPEPTQVDDSVEENDESEIVVEPTQPPTATPTNTPSPTPVVIPVSHSLENVGTVIQGFNNCGPANLAIVLNYFGNETTQEEARQYLKPNREDRNVSPWQINDYVNSFTELRSTARSGGDMEMLKQFVAAGIPVVVEKGYLPNEEEGWYGHYLTVFGYDDEKQEVYSRDTDAGPFNGEPRIDTYEDFAFWWQQFNYTFYVVFEPSQTDLVWSIMPEPLHTDRAMWEYTAELARTEAEADPDNVFATFNLGVSLTRLGELTGDQSFYEAGAVAFDQAREVGLPPRTLYYEHRPFMAYWKTGRLDDVLTLADAMLATTGGRYVEEIFWFQGHALAQQGDYEEAKTAYENALRVNENFQPAADSLEWLLATFFNG